MIFLELFFGVIGFFTLLVFALGISLWFNMRNAWRYNVQRDKYRAATSYKPENVIEGDYEVVEEPRKKEDVQSQ